MYHWFTAIRSVGLPVPSLIAGRTEAAAVAAAEHITVVKQLIDLVSSLNRSGSEASIYHVAS